MNEEQRSELKEEDRKEYFGYAKTLEYQDEINDIVEERYNDELNFNNADKTSGQRVNTKEEIKDLLLQSLHDMK